MSLMKKSALLIGALVLATGVAYAGGFFTNGLPVAGQSPYTTTLPLTGLERIPADTQLSGGASPQSEAITTAQLSTFVAQTLNAGAYSAATNTSGFTATTAQISGAPLVVLNLTGTLAAAANVTTPTASAIWAAIGNAQAGQSYVLRIINNSSGAYAWTLVGGTGVTVSGTASVAQNVSREWLVTLTSSTAVTMQNIGSGAN